MANEVETKEMTEQATKLAKEYLEYIIEIERMQCTEKKSWMNALNVMRMLSVEMSGGTTVFEVFNTTDLRKAEITRSLTRMSTVDIKNCIRDARIVDYDLDVENDLYYAKIRIAKDSEDLWRINEGKGKFLPRLMAETVPDKEHPENKNGISRVTAMICLDYVWKKGENTDEVSGGDKDSQAGGGEQQTSECGGTEDSTP